MAKELIRFTVDKSETKQIETKRTNEETGEEEIVLQNKNVKTPVEFVMHAPTRRLQEDAEMHYSVQLSKAVKNGVLTKAMLIKKYADTGGALTEDETREMVKKLQRSNEISNEIQMLHAEDKKQNKEKIDELNQELLKIRKEMIDLESALQGVYQHTADAKAERSLLVWYIINLFKKVEEGKEKEIFAGVDYEDKLESFYKMDESEDDFESKLIEKLSRAVSFWMYGDNEDKNKFKKFIENKDE
jgi:cellobiose-specific phosphotransferase system component IIA